MRRARTGKLAVEDFAGTTATITNPGTIGTVHSVPRLMPGQGCIVGVGAMEYPAEYAGRVRGDPGPAGHQQGGHAHLDLRPPDHPGRPVRVSSCRRSTELLLGEDGFYDGIFAALRIPYEPVRWVSDFAVRATRTTSPGPPGCTS